MTRKRAQVPFAFLPVEYHAPLNNIQLARSRLPLRSPFLAGAHAWSELVSENEDQINTTRTKTPASDKPPPSVVAPTIMCVHPFPSEYFSNSDTEQATPECAYTVDPRMPIQPLKKSLKSTKPIALGVVKDSRDKENASCVRVCLGGEEAGIFKRRHDGNLSRA